MSQATQTTNGKLIDRLLLEAAFTQALHQFKTRDWSLNQSIEALFNATDEFTESLTNKVE